MAGASLPGFAAPTDHGMTWTAPAHWQAQPGNSVRIGSYKVAGADGSVADVSITVFPGDVGGDLANVNRWRQQIGLGQLSESELANALKPQPAPAGTFLLANFSNAVPSPTRVLAAIFKQPDRTWFFKLAGPDALVSAEEKSFGELLASVKFSAPASASPTSASAANSTNSAGPAPSARPITGALPDGHPPIGGTMPAPGMVASGPSTATGPNSLAWAAPDHWLAKSLGAMRRGSFTVRNARGEADCSIILLGAQGNPLLDNVNRWRGQVSLAPLDDAHLAAETTKVTSGELAFAVVDLAGKQPGGDASLRILGAILYRGDEAWFFKLTGPDEVIAAEKAAFLEFLHTVRVAR